MAGPDAQTRMMERLLADPEFRARFRRAPAAVAREEGAMELADELSVVGDPMQTLDFRESRSSVAGVMMAVAVEGLGIYELGKHVLPPLEDAQAASGGSPPPGAASPGMEPDQFGPGRSDAGPSAEALALLGNKNVQLDPGGEADLLAGRIDPRVIALLGAISDKHQISVSSTPSDQSHGIAFDITAVDGRPVTAGNPAARQVVHELSSVDPSIRPSEIVSPWALEGPAAPDVPGQDHLHVGFDDPIPADWSPPAGAVSSPAAVDLPAVQDAPPGDASNGAAAPSMPVSPDDANGDDGEDGGDGGDEDEPDEDESGHDNWDETHESGSGEDSGGSGDDGSSESGSDEDSGGGGDDGSDGNSDSGSSGDPGSLGDSAPGAGAGGLEVPDAGGDYPGDDAPSEQVAAWMASAAQKRGLPPELPVMAALVESGMKNLGGGDRDSVGFFQMRVGIWNQGAYSGYPRRPELQLQWFLDHAASAKKQRVASGQPVNDPRQYGQWIADVERPAAQYRGRYQLQLEQAQALLKKAGARRGGGGGLDQLVDAGGQQHAGRRALLALAEAKKYTGTPYRWGGSSPKTGFDCSGLVQWAYAKAGIRIPRVTDQQILAANGTKVSRNHLLPGDLVFFHEPGGDYVGHVGISLGGDKFLHAPHTGDVVKTSSLKEPYYAQEFAGARRFDRPVGAGQVVEAAGRKPRSAEAAAARLARAALDRDAGEVRRSNSALFRAVERQEQANDRLNEVHFLRAVQPER